ncbi:hypothetical protein RhiirC2_858654 [Rhizophagus irregularis]|uniref:Uncharacterized protein n=1 Tax=Rhizophagus irregularis TaxID=588596 RepID=A0A2N1M3V0_9GLOM|nr:hypothetical protein RhiirC2_858654 [Rhizophagus irregularis]
MYNDELAGWINEVKQHIKYYEYEHFSNIKVIGAGAFGKSHHFFYGPEGCDYMGG